MTAVTPTEVSYVDEPQKLAYGTAKRRARVYVRVTTTATSDTLNLATYVPNIADVEGIDYETLDGADVVTSANTWSTSTITFAGHAGSGVWETCYIVNFT